MTKEEFLKIADKIKNQAMAEKVRGYLGKAFAKLSTGKDGVTLEQIKKFAEMRKKKRADLE